MPRPDLPASVLGTCEHSVQMCMPLFPPTQPHPTPPHPTPSLYEYLLYTSHLRCARHAQESAPPVHKGNLHLPGTPEASRRTAATQGDKQPRVHAVFHGIDEEAGECSALRSLTMNDESVRR